MKRYFLNLLFLLVLGVNVKAQETEKPENKHGICLSATPHLTAILTYRVDADKQIGNTRSWITGSFSYTNRGVNSDFFLFDYNKIMGYGFAGSYRYYVFSANRPKWLYFQGGFVLEYSEMSRYGYGWEESAYLGASAYHYVKKRHYDKVIRTGGDFKIGCMIKSTRYVFFDFYVGVGYREIENIENHTAMQLDTEFFEPKYEGYIPLIGVRVGVNL